MDTRESSPILIENIKKGLSCFGVEHTDFGLLTTPQLHYKVATGGNSIDDFVDAYLEFLNLIDTDWSSYENELVLDCANGVGALPMILIKNRIKDYINIELVNTMTDDPLVLNEGCGAEYVHKEARLPTEIPPES